MKNRLSKLSRNASFMLLLLAACGMTSCKDEYTLDDEKPTWLHSSIYETLQDAGKYNYYLRLLDDDDVNPKGENVRKLKDVLSRTGSKTVFVADDDAWNEFFAQNALRPASDPWHTATSYEALSVSQKKLLIHTSMLNNAIVMENLASSEGTNVIRGEYMRRYTDVEVTDSITHVDGNSLPVNYNEGNGEKDYWWRFRTENGGNGLYLVCDSSRSMMIHFTNEHLKKNNVEDNDFAIIMGRERTTEDVHIYDALLLEQDGVAENGYVNKTEKVIYPLPNMAEILKTNGQTNIFSHMLDRWSVPFYNRTVTEAYKDIMASRGITWTDSIFSKRYFSNLSYNHIGLKNDPDGNEFKDNRSKNVFLEFDPSWSEFYDEAEGPEYDMAAMFVPNDNALWEYFTEGGNGFPLIKTYYVKEGTTNEIPYVAPTTQDELFRQIDQIPISVLKSLVNNIMKKSFVGSVPSKMTKLRDDAQDQLFFDDENNSDKDHIQKCLLANNGVVYVMDRVYGPADYTSVAAPAYTTNTNLVMNFAIYNGYDANATDFMGLNYYAYLKAMQSRFALFLPSDDAMQYYYDPVSFKSSKKRVMKFYYKKATFPVSVDLFNYDPATGEIGAAFTMDKIDITKADGQKDVTNRLKDIIESHTIVLKDGREEIDTDIDEYYLAKNGAPIKVYRAIGADGTNQIVKVQGALQIENEKEGIEGSIAASNNNVYTEIKGIQYNNVTEYLRAKNGRTYTLDSPLIPASRSVYNILTDDKNFGTEYDRFYELTEIDDDDIQEAIVGCGLVEKSLPKNKKENELKKYKIFVNDKGPDYNVQFFNNYNYTAFIPTNAAVDEAISKGLPTLDEIRNDWADMKVVMNELDSLRSAMADAAYVEKAEDVQRVGELLPIAQKDSTVLQAKITYLINFIRYHFADNSVFADQSQMESTEFVTSSYDSKKGLFCKINVKRPGNGALQVRDNNQDANGDVTSPWITAEGEVNVMARDVSCSIAPTGVTMNGVRIEGSSFIVIHQIPNVLNHTALDANGRYDSNWATPAAARKYVKRYAIVAK